MELYTSMCVLAIEQNTMRLEIERGNKKIYLAGLGHCFEDQCWCYHDSYHQM